MLKIFLFGLFFCPKLCFTQVTIDSTGSKISSEDAREVLDHHNKIRNDLAIPPLNWKAGLAAYAQAWADSLATFNNCRLRHRQQQGDITPGYGENIYWGSSAESFTPIDASLAWYSEIQYYSYAKLGENNWLKTAHYTQMIWKDTKEVGVGIGKCPGGGVIVVANYNPPGNFTGEYPY